MIPVPVATLVVFVIVAASCIALAASLWDARQAIATIQAQLGRKSLEASDLMGENIALRLEVARLHQHPSTRSQQSMERWAERLADPETHLWVVPPQLTASEWDRIRKAVD